MPKQPNGLYKTSSDNVIDSLLHFADSDCKVMIIEYNGKRLNSIYGLREIIKREKMPLKYALKIINAVLIRQHVFKMLRLIDGGKFKNVVYRFFGVRIGKDVFIAPHVYIDEMFPELILIGDGTIIGEHSAIFAHEFTIKHLRVGKVIIGSQVVVGAFSIVRSGVSVGDRSVIAMDTLVNKDVPPQSEVGGILEHEIKKLKAVI